MCLCAFIVYKLKFPNKYRQREDSHQPQPANKKQCVAGFVGLKSEYLTFVFLLFNLIKLERNRHLTMEIKMALNNILRMNKNKLNNNGKNKQTLCHSNFLREKRKV